MWRLLLAVGAPILILVALNVWSGGELFKLVELGLSSTDDRGSSDPAHVAPEPVYEEPSQAEIEDAMRGAWDCYYDPSINDNWHDDVICRNGVDWFRPTLLPDSDFVTEAEMQAAGDAFETELNARDSDLLSSVE